MTHFEVSLNTYFRGDKYSLVFLMKPSKPSFCIGTSNCTKNYSIHPLPTFIRRIEAKPSQLCNTKLNKMLKTPSLFKSIKS